MIDHQLVEATLNSTVNLSPNSSTFRSGTAMRRSLPLLLALVHAAGAQQNYNVNANPYSQHTQQNLQNQQQGSFQSPQQGSFQNPQQNQQPGFANQQGLQQNNPFNRPLTNNNGQPIPQGPGPVVIQHQSGNPMQPTPYQQNQGNGVMAGNNAAATATVSLILTTVKSPFRTAVSY